MTVTEEPVGQRLDELRRGAEAAAAVAWADETPGALAEALAAVDHLRAVVDGLEARVLAAFDASGEHHVEGHTSPAGWLQHHRRAKRATATRRVHLARALRSMPGTDRALVAGEITLDHAEVLARANSGRRAEAFGEAETALVDNARRLRFEPFARTVRYFMQCVDRTGADDEAEAQAERRAVHASRTFEGAGRIDGWMTPIGFSEFVAELGRIERALGDADWAEARERLGDAARATDLARTPAQRRHDALVEMARRSRRGEPGAAPATVALTVHVDWATACAELARLEGRTDVTPTGERLCELDDGTVIPPSLALSVGLAAEVRRVVFGPSGAVLDYGRARRFFTAVQRNAVSARDRICVHPFGCDTPARDCEMDHRVEWRHGGRTDLINAGPTCPPHHRWKTNHPDDGGPAP